MVSGGFRALGVASALLCCGGIASANDADIVFESSGLHIELSDSVYSVLLVNKSVPKGSAWNKTNNVSYVGIIPPRQMCHNLGDITLRVQPASARAARGARDSWAYFSSANALPGVRAPDASVDPGKGRRVVAAHDITGLLNNTALPSPANSSNPYFGDAVPLSVVRSYEVPEDGKAGVTIKFTLKNTWKEAIRIGGLGLPMPNGGQQPEIEQSVWNDPHIGGDHGYVEWVRVVVDQSVLLAVPGGGESGFEAWRPIMEDACRRDTWEWNVFSSAWADEWKSSVQFPFYDINPYFVDQGWQPPYNTPWPAWHARETVPVTNSNGFSQPWNEPTSRTLAPGESFSVAIRLMSVAGGPRARPAALVAAGKSTVDAVPGFVLAPDHKAAQLFVTPPSGATVASVDVSDPSVLSVDRQRNALVVDGEAKMSLRALKAGRCRVSIRFSDNSTNQAHFAVVPSFREQIGRVGDHWADDAWLPRDFPDPFGRSASVMPWDREDKAHVLDDSRAYDVGLSDDAGGGNPLGFATKVAFAPNQHQIQRLDDYVKWTLYGVKPDVAKPPLKSLQIRPEDIASNASTDLDGIRMTMYYYNDSGFPSPSTSGHFKYDYKEADKCKMNNGGDGGPNWCMSEHLANATYRSFNYPHHTATYLALYLAARNTKLSTYRSWQWYLARAANTTIRFGAPTVGVMDGTVFREVLRCVREEASVDNETWGDSASAIEANMYARAAYFASEEYPYGSEFAFDTTGQEEVVVWLLHFANSTNGWSAAAKRTVDHVLSYMRASGTWAYNGGSRSWGDLGNNGKWFVTAYANFETRGNMHYRSGLNSIPLLEWYRRNPDDAFLLPVALGAVAGQMTNIDADGAPSMMLHMQPYILDFDPHSGDFGLGFFGGSLGSGAYLVRDSQRGPLCYLCNLNTTNGDDSISLEPVDGYRRRVYLEPLGLQLQLDVGTFARVVLDEKEKQISVEFEPAAEAARFSTAGGPTFDARRLRVQKMASSRPGSNFVVEANKGKGTFPFVRNAYEIPEAVQSVVIQYS